MGLKYRVDFMIPLRLYIALLFLLLVTPIVTHGGQPSQGCSNTTEWKKPYSNNHTIPNFSRVGYRQGHVKIPIVPVKKTLKPAKDQGDDTIRIQKALDEVANLPLAPLGRDGIQVRGAVLLTKGVYRVAKALVIGRHGVVLRGEGPDAGSGTTILATGEWQGDLIRINAWLDPQINRRLAPMYTPPRNGYRVMFGTQIRQGIYIPAGTTVLPVDNTSVFNVGDKIVVDLRDAVEWSKYVETNATWKPDTTEFKFERTIVNIDRSEHTLTIDNPMVMNIDPQYPLGAAKIDHFFHKISMISDVGVENLRLSKQPPKIQEGLEHAVTIDNTIHGWVSDVSTDGFMLGIGASEFSSFITIQNCKVDSRRLKPEKRRIGFSLNGQMSLVNHCETVGAFYDFTSGGPVSGPNVFVGSNGTDSLGPSGPRQDWVMGSLYDNIASGYSSVLNQRLSGFVRGWTGAFNVFYNCKSKGGYSKFESAPGTTNWIIGFKDLPSDYGIWWGNSTIVSPNNTVNPRSLYWSQLAERTGQCPDELMRMNGADARVYSTPEDAGNIPTGSQGGATGPSWIRRVCKLTPLVTHGGLPSQNCSEWKVPDSNNNVIPNFSRVGYRQGHVKIPIVPVKKILNPIPEPYEIDDTTRIQIALDEVGSLPLLPLGRDGIMVRGAVLLTKGVYRVTRALYISKSGVVLRGEGSDAFLGTTILCRRQKQGDFIVINAATECENARSRIEPEYSARCNEYNAMPGTKIREGTYIAVGTTVLPVDDTIGFDIDDKIVVEIGSSKEWIEHIGMDASSYPWYPSIQISKFERKIVDIDRSERTFTIDIPMVMNIDPQYPPRTAKIYRYIYRSDIISDVPTFSWILVAEAA
ncbi:hypothetical protein BGZ68_010507 [Mortierella alpina]|nr:hypothetical protein BGZ68_010507 [Mortierella alpina]